MYGFKNKLVCLLVVCTLRTSAEKNDCDLNLSQVFRTPKDFSRVNFDHFEILERNNFDPTQASQLESANNDDVQLANNPKSMANAQVMLRFGGDDIRGRNSIDASEKMSPRTHTRPYYQSGHPLLSSYHPYPPHPFLPPVTPYTYPFAPPAPYYYPGPYYPHRPHPYELFNGQLIPSDEPKHLKESSEDDFLGLKKRRNEHDITSENRPKILRTEDLSNDDIPEAKCTKWCRKNAHTKKNPHHNEEYIHSKYNGEEYTKKNRPMWLSSDSDQSEIRGNLASEENPIDIADKKKYIEKKNPVRIPPDSEEHDNYRSPSREERPINFAAIENNTPDSANSKDKTHRYQDGKESPFDFPASRKEFYGKNNPEWIPSDSKQNKIHRYHEEAESPFDLPAATKKYVKTPDSEEKEEKSFNLPAFTGKYVELKKHENNQYPDTTESPFDLPAVTKKYTEEISPDWITPNYKQHEIDHQNKEEKPFDSPAVTEKYVGKNNANLISEEERPIELPPVSKGADNKNNPIWIPSDSKQSKIVSISDEEERPFNIPTVGDKFTDNKVPDWTPSDIRNPGGEERPFDFASATKDYVDKNVPVWIPSDSKESDVNRNPVGKERPINIPNVEREFTEKNVPSWTNSDMKQSETNRNPVREESSSDLPAVTKEYTNKKVTVWVPSESKQTESIYKSGGEERPINILNVEKEFTDKNVGEESPFDFPRVNEEYVYKNVPNWIPSDSKQSTGEEKPINIPVKQYTDKSVPVWTSSDMTQQEVNRNPVEEENPFDLQPVTKENGNKDVPVWIPSESKQSESIYKAGGEERPINIPDHGRKISDKNVPVWTSSERQEESPLVLTPVTKEYVTKKTPLFIPSDSKHFEAIYIPGREERPINIPDAGGKFVDKNRPLWSFSDTIPSEINPKPVREEMPIELPHATKKSVNGNVWIPSDLEQSQVIRNPGEEERPTDLPDVGKEFTDKNTPIWASSDMKQSEINSNPSGEESPFDLPPVTEKYVIKNVPVLSFSDANQQKSDESYFSGKKIHVDSSAVINDDVKNEDSLVLVSSSSNQPKTNRNPSGEEKPFDLPAVNGEYEGNKVSFLTPSYSNQYSPSGEHPSSNPPSATNDKNAPVLFPSDITDKEVDGTQYGEQKSGDVSAANNGYTDQNVGVWVFPDSNQFDTNRNPSAEERPFDSTAVNKEHIKENTPTWTLSDSNQQTTQSSSGEHTPVELQSGEQKPVDASAAINGDANQNVPIWVPSNSNQAEINRSPSEERPFDLPAVTKEYSSKGTPGWLPSDTTKPEKQNSVNLSFDIMKNENTEQNVPIWPSADPTYTEFTRIPAGEKKPFESPVNKHIDGSGVVKPVNEESPAVSPPDQMNDFTDMPHISSDITEKPLVSFSDKDSIISDYISSDSPYTSRVEHYPGKVEQPITLPTVNKDSVISDYISSDSPYTSRVEHYPGKVEQPITLPTVNKDSVISDYISSDSPYTSRVEHYPIKEEQPITLPTVNKGLTSHLPPNSQEMPILLHSAERDGHMLLSSYNDNGNQVFLPYNNPKHRPLISIPIKPMAYYPEYSDNSYFEVHPKHHIIVSEGWLNKSVIPCACQKCGQKPNVLVTYPIFHKPCQRHLENTIGVSGCPCCVRKGFCDCCTYRNPNVPFGERFSADIDSLHRVVSPKVYETPYGHLQWSKPSSFSAGYSSSFATGYRADYSQVGNQKPKVNVDGYRSSSGGGFYSNPHHDVYYKQPTVFDVVRTTDPYKPVLERTHIQQPQLYKVVRKYDIVPKEVTPLVVTDLVPTNVFLCQQHRSPNDCKTVCHREYVPEDVLERAPSKYHCRPNCHAPRRLDLNVPGGSERPIIKVKPVENDDIVPIRGVIEMIPTSQFVPHRRSPREAKTHGGKH